MEETIVVTEAPEAWCIRVYREDGSWMETVCKTKDETIKDLNTEVTDARVVRIELIKHDGAGPAVPQEMPAAVPTWDAG